MLLKSWTQTGVWDVLSWCCFYLHQSGEDVTHSISLQDWKQTGAVHFCCSGEEQWTLERPSLVYDLVWDSLSVQQTKEVTRSPKSPVDVPVAEGLRSIKSMWEKGNVVNPTPSPASPPAVTKVQEERNCFSTWLLKEAYKAGFLCLKSEV